MRKWRDEQPPTDPKTDRPRFVRLIRRVVTRWNSEHDSIQRYNQLYEPIQDYIHERNSKLDAYRITDEELEILKELERVLEPFKAFTLKFSQGDIPLLCDIIPAFEKIEDVYADVRNRSEIPIVRYAAHHALLMSGKLLRPPRRL